jgi:hypothetical protein
VGFRIAHPWSNDFEFADPVEAFVCLEHVAQLVPDPPDLRPKRSRALSLSALSSRLSSILDLLA